MNQSQKLKTMNEFVDPKDDLRRMIEEAYQDGQNTWAYYLELCLKTNSLPR